MLSIIDKTKVLIAAALITPFSLSALYAETIYPFDGESLNGWEIQGEGTWDVVDGALHGLKLASEGGWGHLVSETSFENAKISLRYKVVSSNSGVYVRSHIVGDFGVDGLQVDIGQLSKDAMPMGVTDTEFMWLEVPEGSGSTAGMDTTDANFGQWNELDIEVNGQQVTTWLNGRQIVTTEVEQKWMPAEGRLAFQLHAVIPTFVTPEVEVFFKDIKIVKN